MVPMVVVLAGCDGSTDTDATDTDTAPATDVVTDTGDTGDSTTETGLVEVSLTLSEEPGPGPTQRLLRVDSVPAAAVAVWCVADDLATEGHLLESPSATSHELRLQGLMADQPYTCTAVATTGSPTSRPATVTLKTPQAPFNIPRMDVTVDAGLGMTGSYTLASWGAPTLTPEKYLVIWSADGEPRWWYQLPKGVGASVEALFDPGTTQLLWGGGLSPSGAPTLTDLWDGNQYVASLPAWPGSVWSHDTKRIPDGRILSVMEVPNSGGADTWTGFGLRIHDPATDQVEFQYDSQRLVDEGFLDRPRPTDEDPYHINWAGWQQTPTGPEVYVSLCYAEQILGIDGDDGSLLWQLGRGLGWTVKDADGSTLPDTELPSCQHGLEVDGDVFYVYDNGRIRSQSQAVVWRIDGETKTATRQWSWTEPGWFEPIVGDIDVLSPERVLVHQAHIACCATNKMVEVDVPTGQVASTWALRGQNNWMYRSERYDGCALFANTAYCPSLAARREELEPLFAR